MVHIHLKPTSMCGINVVGGGGGGVGFPNIHAAKPILNSEICSFIILKLQLVANFF